MKQLYFYSHGVRCAAWHLPAETDALTGESGRPCVVMAHGCSGTKDTALLGFAGPFAAAGLVVLVFDYRGFGESEGTPRQDVSISRQRQDYHAAIAAARHLPGVNPDLIVLWGTSYAGGGTMMNEGASKGILVCTSGYGPDAFTFSRDKPIELIDGGGLLCLLREHAGTEARIVVA